MKEAYSVPPQVPRPASRWTPRPPCLACLSCKASLTHPRSPPCLPARLGPWRCLAPCLPWLPCPVCLRWSLACPCSLCGGVFPSLGLAFLGFPWGLAFCFQLYRFVSAAGASHCGTSYYRFLESFGFNLSSSSKGSLNEQSEK